MLKLTSFILDFRPRGCLAAFPGGSAWSRSFASSFPKRIKSQLHPDDHFLPTVCLIGRPNVGKSQIFNKLLRKVAALVYDTPLSHVTRDYKEGIGKLGDLRFKLIDTSGLEPSAPQRSIQGRATEITSRVVRQSHLVLMIVDAKAGLLASDEELAQWLKRQAGGDKILVVANKAENQRAREGMSMTVHDCYRLGFGEPVAISASTGEGFVDLYSALRPLLDTASDRIRTDAGLDPLAKRGRGGKVVAAVESKVLMPDGENKEEKEEQEAMEEEGTSSPESNQIRVAIIGLTNVGKSTLMNQLLKDQRSLTGPEPGLTRDSVSASMTLGGNIHMELVDTAGWVGQTKTRLYDDVGGAVAEMARKQTSLALGSCHVAVLVIDAQRAAEEERVMNQRELALAGLALEEGRALVICANKLDALTPEDQRTFVDTLTGLIQERFLDAGRLPVVGLSALTGKGLDCLLPTVQQAFESWNKRVNTGKINRMLEQLRAERTQASSQDVIARIKYMCQIKARPPSFVAFLSGSSPVPESGIKHLAQSIRERLGFDGIPVRLWMRPAEARSLLARSKTARAGRPMGMRGGMATRQRRKKALDLSMSQVRYQAATRGEKEPKKVPFKLRVKLFLQENKLKTA